LLYVALYFFQGHQLIRVFKYIIGPGTYCQYGRNLAYDLTCYTQGITGCYTAGITTDKLGAIEMKFS